MAKSGVDAFLVTKNGHSDQIREAVLQNVFKPEVREYWENLLDNQSYYGSGDKTDEYQEIIGDQNPAKFMLVDDAPSNVASFNNVTGNAGYAYIPSRYLDDAGPKFAKAAEFSTQLDGFLEHMQSSKSSTNSSSGNSGSGSIEIIGSSRVGGTFNNKGKERGDFEIDIPTGAQPGDVMVVFSHVTDGPLKADHQGWNNGPSIMKKGNGDDGDNIDDYGTNRRADLGQTMHWRVLTQSDINKGAFKFDQPNESKIWVTSAVLKGVDTDNPIVSSAATGVDKNKHSVFPGAYAEEGDFILLSQSYDDRAGKSHFSTPPDGFEFEIEAVMGDETAHLYSGEVTDDMLANNGNKRPGVTYTGSSSGAMTNSFSTEGDGSPREGQKNKDATMTIVFRPAD